MNLRRGDRLNATTRHNYAINNREMAIQSENQSKISSFSASKIAQINLSFLFKNCTIESFIGFPLQRASISNNGKKKRQMRRILNSWSFKDSEMRISISRETKENKTESCIITLAKQRQTSNTEGITPHTNCANICLACLWNYATPSIKTDLQTRYKSANRFHGLPAHTPTPTAEKHQNREAAVKPQNNPKINLTFPFLFTLLSTTPKHALEINFSWTLTFVAVWWKDFHPHSTLCSHFSRMQDVLLAVEATVT